MNIKKKCNNLHNKIKSYLKRRQGYSLFEVVVVIIIITTIIALAFKIKDQIFASLNMNNTKQSIEILASNITGAYGGSKYSDIDTQRVIEMGLVPKVMSTKGDSKIIHPLKGEVEVEKGSNGDTFIITLNDLSNEACLQLEVGSRESWASVDSHCGSSSKSNSISFESY